MDQSVIEGYKTMRKAMAASYRWRDFGSIFSDAPAFDDATPRVQLAPEQLEQFARDRLEEPGIFSQLANDSTL